MSCDRKNRVAETASFWSERTGEIVSHDDAREMIQNVSSFFGIHKRWQLQRDGDLSSGERELESEQKNERIYSFEDNATMPKI